MRNAYDWIIAALVAIGIIFIGASFWPALAADAVELGKMQGQMFGHTVQLDKNCSGSVIYSKRDEVSGKVSTLILTAKHCVDGDAKKEYEVNFPVYQNNRIVKTDSFKALVKGQYYKADLALLELRDTQTFFKDVAKIEKADATFLMGEDIWTVGYPLGLAMTVTDGQFGSLETFNYPTSGMEYLRATPNIAPGNSGGAAYHKGQDGNYYLIGVTTAGFQGFPWINLYTPLSAIHEYLKVAAPDAIGLKPATSPHAK